MTSHLTNLSPRLNRLCAAALNRLAPAAATFATEATFTTDDYKLHRIEHGTPSTSVTITRTDALRMYEEMYTIRRIEMAAGNLYKAKIIRGFCHLYSGQEAIAVGIRHQMRPDDGIITAYRCHGWCYLMGATVEQVLSELTGRSTGVQRGKGGSMHMYMPNFYGGNGIVGAQVPLGAGVAFAKLYMSKKNVCIAGYGDGASNQGQLFEAYNIAKLWKLPAIFLCENNGYGMGTSSERSSASTEYYKRGDYCSGIWVDGMDVLAVREATRFAIDMCDNGMGPVVMEGATYRYSGHSMSDPGTSYRSRDEVEEVRKSRDPITNFREKILSQELATEAEITEIDDKVKAVLVDATAKAQSSPEIGLHELTADIYQSSDEPIRNVLPNMELKHTNLGKAINI